MLVIWHGGEWLKRDLAQPFYGWVECGSPIPSLGFASLMKVYLSLYFYEHFDGLYVVNMSVLSWVFLSHYVGYVCVLWQQPCMYFLIFLILIEWSMYILPNGWNDSWFVGASMALSDSKLSMKPICSELLITHVDYTFVICLTKCLSWLVGSSQGIEQVFSLILSFPCYFTNLKRWFNFGWWPRLWAWKSGSNPRVVGIALIFLVSGHW